MALNIATSTFDRLKFVRAACAGTEAGPARDTALAHLRTAETAHADWRDDICAVELDAAIRALG